MSGSLMASEAVLQAVMHTRQSGKGVLIEVALAHAAAYVALPRVWGLTTANAVVGGGHAGYQVYACKNGRVAVAALEPHFATALCAAAGLQATPPAMFAPDTQRALRAWLLHKTRAQLDQLARDNDLPLHTMT